MGSSQRHGRRQAGLGLAEVLVAGGIAVGIMLAVAKMATSNLKFSRKVDSSTDLSSFKAILTSGVDCAASFSPTPPACAAGSYVNLRARDGAVVVSSGGTAFGKWTVLAQCTATGLDVRAAVITPAGGSAARNFSASNPNWFSRDEVAGNLAYDWNHPKSRLFPTGPTGICGHLFGGTSLKTTCSSNEYVSGINFTTRELACSTIPQCPVNEALSWNGSSFVCVAARTDNYITNNLVNPAISNNNIKISNTPFECVTGYRARGGGLQDGGSAMKQYDSGNKWGMYCTAPYSLTGCSFYNGGSNDDWDVRNIPSGCVTDDEERGDGTLTLTCCRNGDVK